MAIRRAVNQDFFKKWTPEMAYVLGFFAADGYMTINNRGGRFWNIQITDKELLERIKEAVHSEHKIGVRTRAGNENTIYRLQIGSKEMCKDLQKLGFNPRKTKSLAIPKVPRKYFSHFIRGYFDGDGNVWVGFLNKKRITPTRVLFAVFTSCSTEFLQALKQRLHAFGLEGGCLYQTKETYARLQFSIKDSLKLYELMYNRYAPIGALFLERKKQVFEKYTKMRS